MVQFDLLNGSADHELGLSATVGATTFQASGGAFTIGGASGEGAAALINDLRGMGITDSNPGDTFQMSFTLQAFTGGVATGAPAAWSEAFFTACYAPGTRIATGIR